ncbi:MAG: hypothetical protein CSA74_07000 [Rhodobacterales bacterium]|nr:MAG: hypothetical protein CSA74_07000 [Rhodobacterales bacterium]
MPRRGDRGEYPPEYLFEGKKLRVSVRGPGQAKLMVTHDYWSRAKPGFGRLDRRSRYADRGFTHLHLHTRQNDWFLNRETEAALAVIEAYAKGFDMARSIGFSMGSYGAMLVSRVVTFEHVLLVSPHLTFSEHQYPHETRFPSHMANLGRALKLNARVFDGPPARARAAVIHDSRVAGDLYHARLAASRFTDAELVDLETGGHPATTRLTRGGQFNLVLDAITGPPRGPGLDMAPVRRAHAALLAPSP